MTAGLRLLGGLAGLAVVLAGTSLLPHASTVTDPVVRSGAPRYAVPGGSSVPQARETDPSSGSARASGPAVDEQWVARTARTAGIPVPAVRAYGTATLRADEDQPGCRLAWTTLAGIGYVESRHGTIGGRRLGADGRSDPLVLGVALDGTRGTAAIPATEDSVPWHGDPSWDHAVGPLQFIPSTWRQWASDGDGNGTTDPNDLDDAAWAAARYLCADGRDLDAGTGWSAAVFSYNHADTYVRAVYDAASAYASRT